MDYIRHYYTASNPWLSLSQFSTTVDNNRQAVNIMETIVAKRDNIVNNIHYGNTIIRREYCPNISNMVLSLGIK